MELQQLLPCACMYACELPGYCRKDMAAETGYSGAARYMELCAALMRCKGVQTALQVSVGE